MTDEAAPWRRSVHIRDLAGAVDEAPTAPEACPHDRRHRIRQAVKVTVSHDEVHVEAIMGQDGSRYGPTQEQPEAEAVWQASIFTLRRWTLVSGMASTSCRPPCHRNDPR
jgi:hypothetical protein